MYYQSDGYDNFSSRVYERIQSSMEQQEQSRRSYETQRENTCVSCMKKYYFVVFCLIIVTIIVLVFSWLRMSRSTKK